MAKLTLRNLGDEQMRLLALRAAQNERTLEDEARAILIAHLTEERVQSDPTTSQRLRELFAGLVDEPVRVRGRDDAPRGARFPASGE